MSLLPEYTQQGIRRNDADTIPQIQAFDFVINDPLLDDYEGWRIKQRFALAALYYATGGDDWSSTSGWLAYRSHECTWSAMPPVLHTNLINDRTQFHQNPGEIISTQTISNFSNPCEEEDRNDIQMGRYYHLWLQENNLNGTLPPEIFEMLTSLRTINFDQQVNDCYYDYHYNFECDSKLTGRLPSEVGLLTELEVLSLDYQSFSGQIPATIGQMSSLEILRLHGNNFAGTLPFSFYQLANLQFLDIVRNEFLVGTIAPEIQKLTNLEHFLMYRTALTGRIPCEIEELTNLIYFDVGGQGLSGSICTEFGKLTKLQHLHIESNETLGEIPDNLALLTRISGTIPSELGELTELKNLHLPQNLLSGTVPTTFAKLTALESLQLDVNHKLNGSLPSQLDKLTSLERVNLFLNAFTGTVPQSLGVLVSGGSLQVFILSFNQFSGTVPPDLCPIGEMEFDCNRQNSNAALCGCACDCPTMPPTTVENEGNIFQ